jgi:hypothetical protein
MMWPNRVGGIAATCAEAFRPYSPVLANLTGTCYWWGWVPTCGLTALLSASALHHWYLHSVPIKLLAVAIVVLFTLLNLAGMARVTRVAVWIACGSAALAFASGIIPVLTGHVDWHEASSFHLDTPFRGVFGAITTAMAGLYLIGFAAPAFEAASWDGPRPKVVVTWPVSWPGPTAPFTTPSERAGPVYGRSRRDRVKDRIRPRRRLASRSGPGPTQPRRRTAGAPGRSGR